MTPALAAWALLFPALLLINPATCAAAAAGETLSAETWLARVNTALRTLNYAGTFVYTHGDQISSVRVIHRGDAEGGVERLESLNGLRHEVIRDHQTVESVLPESRRVLMERRAASLNFPTALVGKVNATKLGADYRLENVGSGRVAGLHCHVISVLPRDQYRYGYKLWIDVHTGMLLRSDLLEQDGQVLARVMFTSLRYPHAIPDSALTPTEIRPGFVWIRQGDDEKPAPDETDVHWQVGRLPPGFTLASQDVQRMVGTHRPVRHFVFSDGLATVSVFAEPAGYNAHALLGPSSMGPVNAFGRDSGGHHLTVIGEVPADTVKMVADSMRPVGVRQP
ncbi:MAG: MucB/RseB C-terminal domain-containing protein [Gammaproteobacteria bacterium]